jgi:rhodanese-related sulfurtransferase
MTRQTDSRGGASRRVVLGALGAAAVLGAGGFAFSRRGRFDGRTMTPPALREAVAAGTVLLVDIRRPDEWAATGIAEGAHPIDMRRPDFPEALAQVRAATPDLPVALICAQGVRSAWLAARLEEAGVAPVVNVPEGMLGSSAGPGWIARDLPVVRP